MMASADKLLEFLLEAIALCGSGESSPSSLQFKIRVFGSVHEHG